MSKCICWILKSLVWSFFSVLRFDLVSVASSVVHKLYCIHMSLSRVDVCFTLWICQSKRSLSRVSSFIESRSVADKAVQRQLLSGYLCPFSYKKKKKKSLESVYFLCCTGVIFSSDHFDDKNWRKCHFIKFCHPYWCIFNLPYFVL